MIDQSLSIIADLKTHSIVQWRQERKEDAVILQDREGLAQWFQKMVQNPSDEEIHKNILSRISHLQSINQYDIFFLTRTGTTVYSFPSSAEAISDETASLLNQHLTLKDTTVIDLHLNQATERIEMGVMVPIFLKNSDNTTIGFIYLRINPSLYLYPLLDQNPSDSIETKTSLYRKEGNYAISLNKHDFFNSRKNIGMISIADNKNPAVQAVLGKKGFFIGIDNQGENVYSEIRSVPDSPWLIVSSINQTSAHENLYSQLYHLILLFLALLLIITLDLFQMIKSHQRMQKKEWEAYEIKKNQIIESLKISEERCKTLIDSAGEYIVIAQDGFITYFNPRVIEISEYTEKELLSKPFSTFIHPDDHKLCFDDSKTTNIKIPFSFRLLTASGGIKWVTAKTIKIEWQEKPGILIFLTDISDRKKIEKDLEEQNLYLTKLNQFSINLLKLSSLSDLNSLITENLKEISGAEAIVFSVYNREDKTNYLKKIEIKSGLLDTINQLLGRSVMNEKSFVSDDVYKAMTEEMIGYQSSLYDASLGSIPLSIANTIQKLLRIDRFIGLAYVVDGELYGSSLLAYKKEQPEPPKTILENFVYIVASALKRKVAEEALHQFHLELENIIQRRTQDLENSNKALEAFSHSVSHDLRAPLRAINGFSQLLVQKYQDVLDNEASRLVKIVVENTNRMDQLINGLLKISKVSSLEIKKNTIDMNAMVCSVIAENVSKEDKDRITFIIPSLIEGFGDHVLIRQVWVNLLENAIKFSRKKEKPVIKLSSYPENNQIIYQIKDNGAGFNSAYQNKLYTIFQRLHSEEEFQGTGVGLALIHRIIQKHGGKVWAEGEEGQGATFYFSLPIINKA